MTEPSAHAAGSFGIGGKNVARLGFGAMRLTGLGIWGEPEDRDECVRVVRRAVELGVQLIDTADSYGPYVSEEIIREAIHPYPDDVLIATKAGLTRNGPDVIKTDHGLMRLGPKAWPAVGRPEYLRQQAEMVDRVASAPASTASQVALAWLLARSRSRCPFPARPKFLTWRTTSRRPRCA